MSRVSFQQDWFVVRTLIVNSIAAVVAISCYAVTSATYASAIAIDEIQLTFTLKSPNAPQDLAGLDIRLQCCGVGDLNQWTVGDGTVTIIPTPSVFEHQFTAVDEQFSFGIRIEASASAPGSVARFSTFENIFGAGHPFASEVLTNALSHDVEIRFDYTATLTAIATTTSPSQFVESHVMLHPPGLGEINVDFPPLTPNGSELTFNDSWTIPVAANSKVEGPAFLADFSAVAALPEPATCILLATGWLAIVAGGRRSHIGGSK